jgi:hypothetical protein
LNKEHVISIIRAAFAKCPDAAPAQATHGLAFITDSDLRELLRADIASADQSFIDREWKASTVLAGSIVEALLLWAIETLPAASLSNAAKAAVASGALTAPPKGKPVDWVLDQYIEIALAAKLIKVPTATAARLAKGFRNLIHPGRAARLGAVCNRGTALSALAAMEHVIHDLA